MPQGYYQPQAGGPGLGAGPAPTAAARTTAAPTQPYGYSPGYGYGYGYAPPQQQQAANSTSTPYASVYPVPQTLPLGLHNPHGIIAGEDEGEGPGLLDMAKGWMQTAGDKLAEAEAEVWRRINEAHGEK